MSTSELIEVMISSQCNWTFPNDEEGRILSDIRKKLKEEIDKCELFGKQIFKVWINEETTSQPLSETSWDVCINKARNCDILISLYNGHAGYPRLDGDVGICEAELNAAFSQAPGKVRIIELGDTNSERSKETDQSKIDLDNHYYERIKKTGAFWSSVSSYDELLIAVKSSLFDIVLQLFRGGLREINRGNAFLGIPLEWRRLNYVERQEEMIKTLSDTIKSIPGSKVENDHLFVNIYGHDILFIPSAIPDSMSISQAKEMVGQPFLKDFEKVSILGEKYGGPMHVIACYGGATESQAKKLLGFPDATVIPAPFGVYVADNVQKVQFVFISKCSSPISTKDNFLGFINWLRQGDEDQFLSKRAISRAKIIRVIAEEYYSQ